ncbi:MAG: hypothetical protein JKY27_03085 [Magnetovibrio sp.]|nr:hypothetical protein [Magnetovibrio sp.]
MIDEAQKQWVCVPCGYNMIGEMPNVCPFCGARHDQFVTWQEAERIYRVTPTRVNDAVSQLMSVPRLGIEHAAYRVETKNGAVWIDCPSAFNRDLVPVKAIYFTHKDFLGASNQYRDLWQARVGLHALAAEHLLARPFTIDDRFKGDFNAYGIDAFHIGGHTQGFTIYIFDDTLFVCDYAYYQDGHLMLNVHGDPGETKVRGQRIVDIARQRSLKTVCGYNYVAPFEGWIEGYEPLVA